MKRGASLLAVGAAILWLAAMAIYLVQQERPTGWLRGKAVAEESGQPLPGVMIRLHLADSAPPDDERDFVLRTGADGTFRSRRLPAGSYSIEASSRAHRLRAANLVVEEGKVREVSLELGPVPPFFHLGAHQHVFTPDETPRVLGSGFVPGEAVDFAVYRVAPEVLFDRYGGELRRMLYSPSPPQRLMLDDNPGLSPARRFSAPITRRDVEGVFRQRFDMPAREPGIYVVVARAGAIQRLDWLMVTRLGLITKQWDEHALAFVSDLKTGEPVAGARVEFSPGQGTSVAATTDNDGLVEVTVPPPARGRGYDLLVRAQQDGSQAFLTSSMWPGEDEGQERVYFYTDRPIYRPGHRVHFRGIARRFADNTYSVPAGEPVEVKVWDPRDTLVYRGKLATDEFGSYHGNFLLNDEAATGYYRVVSEVKGRPQEAGLRVAEYRKPEYRVEVATSKKRYTQGERIRVSASAEYYFGAPVAGAQVTYLVRRSPYWFYPGAADEYDYEGAYFGDYGEVIEEGTAETDARGVARFSVATRSALYGAREEAAEPSDYRYTIEVTVTDPSRREVTAEGSTLVTQGEFALLVTPARYVVEPGQPAEFEIEARDYHGRPVQGVRIQASAGPEIWSGDKSRLEREAQRTLTTDARGKARFSLKPRTQGYYRVDAGARDRRGNQVRAAAYVWVTGSAYADLGVPYPRLEIVADKPVYRAGETATVVINSESAGATALLTVEGQRLYERRLVPLRGKSTRLEVTVKPQYAPNFFVSVAFVRNKQFMNDEKRIKVSVVERKLQVRVRPDKRRYAPGETATYELRAADWQGNPVSAELSVGVVDEAIYALEPESAPPMLGFFYPPRANQVQTAYSFPQIYLDADKAGAGISVRRHFPDTAYWNPAVVTDAQGRAKVSFVMPDTLTTWRATVRGVTMDTAVGEAVSMARVSKDLLVRLQAPRFLVQGDRVTLSALAHNYTRSQQSLQVWLRAPGLSLRGASAARPQRFELGRDRVRRANWEAEAPAPGEREVTAYLRAQSGLSDAMALPVPVLPHGRERIEWRSGAVSDEAGERLIVRRDAVAGAGDLRVRLAPSIASVMFGALDYLVSYPYGCTEQTMSSFLPDVVVARALRDLDLPNSRLDELPDMVQEGLNRLYGLQHDDGGWGWWRYDQADPWMTAYVVFGLMTAQRSGFTVNQAILDQGRQRLLRHVREYPNRVDAERAYALYALSLAGADGFVDDQVMRFYRALDGLDTYSLALVAATLQARGREAEAQVAAERLWRRAQETQALAWWKGRAEWGRGGNTETTALALQSLLAVEPGDPRLYKAVRWLVLNREGNHWVSTRDTAFVLFALTDFLKASRELQPDYRAEVSLNGKPLLTRRFTRDDLFAPEVEVRVSGRSLRRGVNTLRLSKAGPGSLYYTAVLRQFVGQEEIPELITGAGISVRRSYYRMISTRDRRTGAFSTVPAPDPTTAFRSGESILVRLTITSPRHYDYVVVEDPLPAGCEVAERGDLEPWEWDRWWSDMDVRDEKVAVFARRLPAGASTIEYHLRPQIPGDYHVMPTQVYAMYNPDLRGAGAETRVRLR